MPRTKSFSLFALIIALLVHFIVFLGIVLFNTLSPKLFPQPKEKPQESRFKISIKERPKAAKEALVKNTIQKITKAPPMPKGEQLTKPTFAPKAQKVPDPKPAVKPQTAQPITPAQESAATPPEPKRAFERHVAPQVATIEKKRQPQGLYDVLSKADPDVREKLISENKFSPDIKKTYGEKFNQLSEGEKKFIMDNMTKIWLISTQVLNRYSQSRIPNNFRGRGEVLFEFYLHPDGSISGLKVLKHSNDAIMDSLFTETIELAYSKYPRPEQPTLIRYIGYYNIR